MHQRLLYETKGIDLRNIAENHAVVLIGQYVLDARDFSSLFVVRH
jgi:hypothetical protein